VPTCAHDRAFAATFLRRTRDRNVFCATRGATARYPEPLPHALVMSRLPIDSRKCDVAERRLSVSLAAGLFDAGVGDALGYLALQEQEHGEQRQDAEYGGGHGLRVLDGGAADEAAEADGDGL